MTENVGKFAAYDGAAEGTDFEEGAVYELKTDGTSGLLYPAGSPEAEEFHKKYGDPEHPVELEPAEPA